MLNGFFTYSGGTHNADSTVLTLSKPQYTIGGLTTSATYTINMTGSLNSATNFASLNKYRIVGATTYVSGTFNSPNGCYTNTSGGVTFPNVQPDGSGNIKVYLFTEVGQEAAPNAGIKGVQN